MSRNSKPVAGVVLGISVIAVLSVAQMQGPDVEPPAAAMTAEGVTRLPAAPRTVAGLGVVEPYGGEVDLAAQMPGVISVVHVEEGDVIARDAVLAELYNGDLKARVAQAEASLAIKRVEFDRLKNGARPQEIRKAEGQLREEDGTLKLLQLQYDRRNALMRKGAVAAESFDEAARALAGGRERRDAAEQSLSLLREGARAEDIAASSAEILLAEHQLDEAVATLSKSYIRATTDGVVLRLYRDPGEAISTQPAIPVIQIGDISKLVVRAQIDEADITGLRIGQTAEISAPALAGKKLKGRVSRISPRLGAKTIADGSPTEKRDARVLDVMVALEPGVSLPISLRVDVFIDLESEPELPDPLVLDGIEQWSFRK